jgi:hypothetical protein
MATEQTIANLAYHLWKARGCPEGSAEMDWLEAERQVTGRLSPLQQNDSKSPTSVRSHEDPLALKRPMENGLSNVDTSGTSCPDPISLAMDC